VDFFCPYLPEDSADYLHKKQLKETQTSGVWIKKCNFALQFIKV
jgi:hypothetical protein